MSSPREVILAALQSALAPILPGAVWRSRTDQLPTLPAIVIRPESEEDPGQILTVHDVTLTVAIACYARGEIPEQALDPILSDVINALQSDPTLGLGSDVQVMPPRRIEWDSENDADARATLRVDITYRTF